MEKTVHIPITGMSCANCAANIERVLKRIDGISDARVNFASEQATAFVDGGKIRVSDLVGAIKRAGFDVPTATAEFGVSGMTCANCAANIERTL